MTDQETACVKCEKWFVPDTFEHGLIVEGDRYFCHECTTTELNAMFERMQLAQTVKHMGIHTIINSLPF